jgi:hypothetical protein
VAKLYDLGVPPRDGGHHHGLRGTITAVASNTVTVAFGEGASAHSVQLDISQAQLLAGPRDPSDRYHPRQSGPR